MKSASTRPVRRFGDRRSRRTAVIVTGLVAAAALAAGGYETYSAAHRGGLIRQLNTAPTTTSGGGQWVITGRINADQQGVLSLTELNGQPASVATGAGTRTYQLARSDASFIAVGQHLIALGGTSSGGTYSGATAVIFGAAPSAVNVFVGIAPSGSVSGVATAVSPGTITVRQPNGSVLALSTGQVPTVLHLQPAPLSVSPTGLAFVSGTGKPQGRYVASQLVILPPGTTGH
jgi:hypothetical protein